MKTTDLSRTFTQLLTVLDSRKYRNIYITKEVRSYWEEVCTLPDKSVLNFRFTGFGKNPNKHKAYVTDEFGKPVSSIRLLSLIKQLRSLLS
jgi:hypothetical protein